MFVEVRIKIKGQKDLLVYSGDRIDILDFQMDGANYKQIRCFRKGFSKSQLIASELIEKIIEIKK